jgi:hypothetical protein
VRTTAQIDIFETDTQSHIKEKLEAVTGIPADMQKLRFGGMNQLYVGDLRTNIKVSDCGTASGAPARAWLPARGAAQFHATAYQNRLRPVWAGTWLGQAFWRCSSGRGARRQRGPWHLASRLASRPRAHRRRMHTVQRLH